MLSSSDAILPLSILQDVSDNPSWFGGHFGFSLGVIFSNLCCASMAQCWGFSQLLSLSSSQSLQWHKYTGKWRPLSYSPQSLAVTFSKSFTLFDLWVFTRHLALGFLRICFLVLMCCHVGSHSLRSCEILIGANAKLCLCAVLNVKKQPSQDVLHGDAAEEESGLAHLVSSYTLSHQNSQPGRRGWQTACSKVLSRCTRNTWSVTWCTSRLYKLV